MHWNVIEEKHWLHSSIWSDLISLSVKKWFVPVGCFQWSITPCACVLCVGDHVCIQSWQLWFHCQDESCRCRTLTVKQAGWAEKHCLMSVGVEAGIEWVVFGIIEQSCKALVMNTLVICYVLGTIKWIAYYHVNFPGILTRSAEKYPHFPRVPCFVITHIHQ